MHQYDDEGFDATSWMAIYAGMDHWPQSEDPVVADIPQQRAMSALEARRDSIAAAVERLPPHNRTLQEVLL